MNGLANNGHSDMDGGNGSAKVVKGGVQVDPRNGIPKSSLVKIPSPVREDIAADVAPASRSLFGGWSLPWSKKKSDEEETGPSNESLLCISFVTFMGFAICQTVAAVTAQSEAMMGDSAAMFVDALTYLFNWVAERRKSNLNDWDTPRESDSERAAHIRKRQKRKLKLLLELIPPLFTVTTMVAVMAFVLNEAIHTLIMDIKGSSEQTNPNLELMFFFSTLNLFLDIFNVCCFAQANHGMGYETNNEPMLQGRSSRQTIGNRQYVSFGESADCGSEGEIEFVETRSASNHSLADDDLFPPQHCHSSISQNDMEAQDLDSDKDHDRANLNMCSAYTHVFADTLRSIAVVLAAIVAKFVDRVTPEEADATAAVVVSALICASLIPLISGLIMTYRELMAIRAEEASEAMFEINGIAPTLYTMTKAKQHNRI